MKIPALIFWAAITPGLLFAQGEKVRRMDAIPIQQVQIDDAFWSPKFEVWREVTIPDCFDKFDRDGTLDNFDKVRDGKGEHRQAPWFDGLLYEMIRAWIALYEAGCSVSGFVAVAL
jgi:hypothetical protein